jgi:hypothetical protein
MPRKAAKRLLVISSDSATGDVEGPPALAQAGSGPLGAVRALRESGAWPDGLELLIISDSYGLVEPLNEAAEAVPVPFSREQNPGWWADFISYNLGKLVEKRAYGSALVLPTPHHEPAVRHCGPLQNINTVWGNTGVAGLAGAELLRAWLSGKARSQKKPRATGPAKPEPKPPIAKQQTASANPEPPQDHVSRITYHDPPPLPAPYAALVEEAIYTGRFMLVVGKASREEAQGIQQALKREWAQRRSRGQGRRSVSNVVIKQARLPWSYSPAATLGGRLLESIGMPALLGSINKAVAQLAITEPGRYRDILARVPEDESEFMTDLLHLLWEASSRMDKDEIALLRAYLSDGCTPGELRRLGLPRNLGLEDRYEVLRVALKCFIGLSPDGILSDYRRVWLWLDEIENLLGYDERERWETVKALETLFGDLPLCLTIWLNITPGKEATSSEIQKALENGLVVTDDLTDN